MNYCVILSLCVVTLDISQGKIVGDTTGQQSLGSYVNLINSLGTTWEAGLNFGGRLSLTEMRQKLGSLLAFDGEVDLPTVHHPKHNFNEFPETLDLRREWPKCPSLKEIRNQGACGSCWAFAAVEVMTDRQCIHSNGTQNFHYSANDVLSCCKKCGHGCNGGYTYLAFLYWQIAGVVSGGPYRSHEGCSPYEIPDDDDDYHSTPKCDKECDKHYEVSYENDLHYSKKTYRVKGHEEHIIAELNKNGPISAAMRVYEDFFDYKKGVYQHKYGGLAGNHAIKIVGYGKENGVKYWLIANSWGNDWGEEGFFKILRGVNECGIEGQLVAGTPDLRS